MKKYKLFIFDLDGVIFDTKLNMKESWRVVRKKHNLKISFRNYFSLIGLPFKIILKKLGVKKNFQSVTDTFSKASKEKIALVKVYPGAKKIIKKLKKNSRVAVVTSKDFKRTKFFLNKFNLKFDFISCPKKGKKGKPYPWQINEVLKKFSILRKDSVYIGDMLVDLEAAKNANIDFILAKYGYGSKKIKIKKNILKIKNLNELEKFKI